ncbi:MaoC/PaaZ C-terminal domain-containing protein [Streptomyces sp. TRM 70351]|uniref:MaoC family dehydratase n=1 Tax=Streptomyces sp. TRM 70351 TaxID=3116552 RepID=UPI002E7B4446|nr:MaoC/PaaZ C-terminal domain-containing protein [Streptomyces sp. TRM 70351]MEE1930817.1 MaoC/PaaZ C-terminal domain-containing protein [Streptomyces sp. TRM 70351]
MRYLTWRDLSIGMTFQAGPVAITPTLVSEFARITGDNAALHTQPDAAARTIYGGLVAHGMLGMSLAHGMLRQALAGLHDDLIALTAVGAWRFHAPIRASDSLLARFEIIELASHTGLPRGTATFTVTVLNGPGHNAQTGRTTLLIRTDPHSDAKATARADGSPAG